MSVHPITKESVLCDECEFKRSQRYKDGQDLCDECIQKQMYEDMDIPEELITDFFQDSYRVFHSYGELLCEQGDFHCLSCMKKELEEYFNGRENTMAVHLFHLTNCDGECNFKYFEHDGVVCGFGERAPLVINSSIWSYCSKSNSFMAGLPTVCPPYDLGDW